MSQTAPMPIATRYVDAAGRRTRVLEAGGGEPLLLIHPFPLTADFWRPQLQAAPLGWRVIAPDALGPSEMSMDDCAARIEAVATSLGLSRTVLGGLSMGGYIIFALLRRAKLSVRGLVLADTLRRTLRKAGPAGRR